MFRRLQVCGSSLYLKNRFGLGYHLYVTCADGADPDAISHVVRQHVPEAADEASVAGTRFSPLPANMHRAMQHRGRAKEIKYLLPRDRVNSFSALFRALEANKTQLSIEEYSITATTLEEVFLQLARQDQPAIEQELADPSTAAAPSLDPSDPHESVLVADADGGTQQTRGANEQRFPRPVISSRSVGTDTTLRRQVKAIVLRRWRQSKRDKRGLFAVVALPLALVAITIVFQGLKAINSSSSLSDVQFTFDPLAGLASDAAASKRNLSLLYSPFIQLGQQNLSESGAGSGWTGRIFAQFSEQYVPRLPFVPEAIAMSAVDATTPAAAMQFLYEQQYAIGAVFISDTSNQSMVQLLYNTTYTHILPTLTSAVSSAIMRTQLSAEGVALNASVYVQSRFSPWPPLPDQQTTNLGYYLFTSFVGFYVAMGLLNAPVFFVRCVWTQIVTS